MPPPQTSSVGDVDAGSTPDSQRYFKSYDGGCQSGCSMERGGDCECDGCSTCFTGTVRRSAEAHTPAPVSGFSQSSAAVAACWELDWDWARGADRRRVHASRRRVRVAEPSTALRCRGARGSDEGGDDGFGAREVGARPAADGAAAVFSRRRRRRRRRRRHRPPRRRHPRRHRRRRRPRRRPRRRRRRCRRRSCGRPAAPTAATAAAVGVAVAAAGGAAVVPTALGTASPSRRWTRCSTARRSSAG